MADGICLYFFLGSIIYPYVQGLFDESNEVLVLFPSMEKMSIVTEWPEMLIWSCIGEGALRCSLNLSSKFPADSPMYSWSQSTLSCLYLYMTPLLLRIGSLSLGAIRRSLMVWPSFRCISIPYGGKEPQYVFLAPCCCLELSCCCFHCFSSGLMFGSLILLCLEPNLGTCICSGIWTDVSLHSAAD